MKTENRSSILKKLGLTEEDVIDSERLLRQIPPPPPSHSSAKYEYCTKAERLLGYTLLRLSREKALRVLGASEEDVDIENSKTLGSLGRSGRRRSFVVRNEKANGVYAGQISCLKIRKSSRGSIKCRNNPKYGRQSSYRRRSTSDLYSYRLALSKDEFVQELKKQNEDASAEITRLKHRLETLEREVKEKMTT